MIEQTNIHVDIGPIIEQVRAMNVQEWSTPLNETTGNILSGTYTVKQQYKNTPLGNVIDMLDDPGEARLLRLASEECYTAHTDPDDRYHLSIIDNEHSYLIDLESKTMHQLQCDGYVYRMDTSITHTAINVSASERIYLNVRVRMPTCHDDPYHLKLVGGDYDYKYKVYYYLMGYLNKSIKAGSVTGLEKINDREFYINCDVDTLDNIQLLVKLAGLELVEVL